MLLALDSQRLGKHQIAREHDFTHNPKPLAIALASAALRWRERADEVACARMSHLNPSIISLISDPSLH